MLWLATYGSDAQWICMASHKFKKCYIRRLRFRQSCVLRNGNMRLYNTVCMWMFQQNCLDVSLFIRLELSHDASGYFIMYMSWSDSGDAYLIRKLLADQGHNQRRLPYLGCTETWKKKRGYRIMTSTKASLCWSAEQQGKDKGGNRHEVLEFLHVIKATTAQSCRKCKLV